MIYALMIDGICIELIGMQGAQVNQVHISYSMGRMILTCSWIMGGMQTCEIFTSNTVYYY
jgi:hypothetical protein